jgi:phospholipase C
LGTAGTPVQGRCGYGTRIPLMVISPYAKANYVDHTLTDQTSVLRFIEDNWLKSARVQTGGSFDTIAGSISNMFDFTSGTLNPNAVQGTARKLVLDKMGRVVSH